MTINDWYTWAVQDATKRLPTLLPLLEGLRTATRELREADWNENAAPTPPLQHPHLAAPERPAS